MSLHNQRFATVKTGLFLWQLIIMTGLTGMGWPAVHASGVPVARYVVVLKRPTVIMHYLATHVGRSGGGGMVEVKPDLHARWSKNHAAALHATQKSVARAVGARIVSSTVNTLDSWTADLTPAQVARLSAMPEVAQVYKDRMISPGRPIEGYRSIEAYWKGMSYRDKRLVTPLVFPYVPAWLGLDGEQGLWRRLFADPARAGSGVVVASLDSGINPYSPSFAGEKLTPGAKTDAPYYQGNTIVYKKADGRFFYGGCDVGPGFARSDCNTKLITARAHIDGIKKYIASMGPGFTFRYDSPRDGDHHGSHTSGIMAGNYHVPVPRTEGPEVDGGVISGIAPGAKLAVYKIGGAYYDPRPGLWFVAGGMISDFVSAMEDAVSDGVDVINLSVGISPDINSPGTLALFNAAAAGVVVVHCAGNDNDPVNPAYYTMNSDYPWMLTVGASSVPVVGGYPAPQTMPFSTTGPVKNIKEQMLVSPDVSAPGYAIVAASDRGFMNDRGTSMASPHVAGLVALYLGLHPHARFGEIESAIMGGARDLVNGRGRKTRDLFAQGSGNVDFARTLESATFYYPMDVMQWKAFANHVSSTRIFPEAGRLSPTDLDYPSAGVDMHLASTVTFQRRVIAEDAGSWRVSVPDFPGYRVTVTPGLHFKRAGDQAQITITVTKTTGRPGSHPAPPGWTTGYLVWHGQGRKAGETSRFALAVFGDGRHRRRS